MDWLPWVALAVSVFALVWGEIREKKRRKAAARRSAARWERRRQ